MKTQQEKWIRKYYQKTKHSIPLFFPNRKSILVSLKSSLSHFSNEYNGFTYDDLTENFGNPAEFANSLIENESAENIRKQLFTSKKLVIAIICLVILIIFTAFGVMINMGNYATEILITTEEHIITNDSN